MEYRHVRIGILILVGIIATILIFCFPSFPNLSNIFQVWMIIIAITIIFLQFSHEEKREKQQEKELIKLVIEKLKSYFIVITSGDKKLGGTAISYHSMPFFFAFNRTHFDILLKLGIEIHFVKERFIEEKKTDSGLVRRSDIISQLRILDEYEISLGTGKYIKILKTEENISSLEEYEKFEKILAEIKKFADKRFGVKIDDEIIKFSEEDKKEFGIE